MAVYERSYRPYQGGFTEPRTRFLVLPRYALRDVFRSRLFASFFAACFLPALVCAGWIYLPHNLRFIETFAIQQSMLDTAFRIEEAFFLRYMTWQATFALILTLIVGPALVSADLRNNGLPLYLSRPFSRTEYVLGKLAVLMLLLSLISWIPGLILFFWQSYLAGFGWFRSHLHVAAALVVGSWAGMLVIGLLALALSAHLRWKPLASAALLGIFFMSSIVANLVNLMFGTAWGSLLDVAWTLRRVWTGLLGMPGDGVTVPVPAAWGTLITVCALSLVLLARRLRAYEVVR